MSRYEIPSIAERWEVIVGWDPPLNTFFAQVYDRSIEDEDTQLIVWEGLDPRHPIHDIERVRRIVYPYTPQPHIPYDVEVMLTRDYD